MKTGWDDRNRTDGWMLKIGANADRTAFDPSRYPKLSDPPGIRLFLVILAAVFWASLPAYGQGAGRAGAAEATFSARVVRVLDGDTVEVQAGPGPIHRIRLHGIDCPERGAPFANVARNFARQLAFDREVTVQVRDRDRYGRLVARVIVDGQDMSVELLKAGLAVHFRRYSSDPVLERAEQQARAARRGIWQHGDVPILEPPGRNARPAIQPLLGTRSDTRVRGNVRSRVFHVPGCRNYTCRNCTAEFASPEEAVSAGYRPAGDCHR